MSIDLGITERECCAKAALADDWKATAFKYRAMLLNIAKHPDTPELIKQYAEGRLNGLDEQTIDNRR